MCVWEFASQPFFARQLRRLEKYEMFRGQQLGGGQERKRRHQSWINHYFYKICPKATVEGDLNT